MYPLGEDPRSPGSGWDVRRLRVVRALFLGGLGILDVDLSFLLLRLGLGGSLLPLLLCSGQKSVMCVREDSVGAGKVWECGTLEVPAYGRIGSYL